MQWPTHRSLLFADRSRSLRSLLESYGVALAGPASVWIAYPKGPIVAVAPGIWPITQVTLDATWRMLRFRPLKPGEAGFIAGT